MRGKKGGKMWKANMSAFFSPLNRDAVIVLRSVWGRRTEDRTKAEFSAGQVRQHGSTHDNISLPYRHAQSAVMWIFLKQYAIIPWKLYLLLRWHSWDVFCVLSLSMHAPYVSVLLFLLLLSFLPPAGVSAARIMHYTSVDLLLWLVDILRWETRCEMCAHTAVCFQRGARRLAGGRRGRSEACRTGACGHLTFSDGWRSCEPRRPIMGCWTWLAPSGLTSPSAASWAMTVPSLRLRLRSEMKGTDGKLKDVSTGRSYLYYLFRCLLEKIITYDDNHCY